jgi:early secretory antigenic target protein ESAT-6
LTRYEVDSSQVAQAGAAVRNSTAAVRAEVATMQRHLADLQNSWRGAAATGFASVMSEWSATQVRVEQSLDNITTALQAAAQTYADAEQQAASLFAR